MPGTDRNGGLVRKGGVGVEGEGTVREKRHRDEQEMKNDCEKQHRNS